MFYFHVTYGDRNIDKLWFDAQQDTLREWHRLDPVDDAERERSTRIRHVQGNHNPFVLDGSLVERILRN